MTDKNKAAQRIETQGGTGRIGIGSNSNPQYSSFNTPRQQPKKRRPCVEIEFCCPKHADMGIPELKRTYRIKRHCEIHAEVRASNGAVAEKLARLGFTHTPAGELDGMAYRFLPDDEVHGSQP